MGGPCLQYVRPPIGEHEEHLCPPCTDNFQVVPGGFEYDGIIWHSVEQAFQSLKFPMGSIAQLEIERAAPRPDESEKSYSTRAWSLGQPRRDTSMRTDWEHVKVKVMTVLNIAKYASSVDFCFDLIETGTNRILGQPSTWKWPYWNAAIQTYIRTELHKGIDLHELLQIIDVMEPDQVELLLSECYDFNASSEAFRNHATGTFELAQVTYSCDPPGAVIPQDSTNWTIPLFNGELVMADVHDFQATFNRYQPDVVITMSSKPPAFPEVAYEGEWLFRNFGGYDLLNMDAMGTIANEAIDALQEGKTVLIHCLHGQDRTGIIAAALIYAGYDHPEIDDRLEIIMTKARIKKDGYWFGPDGAFNRYGYHRIARYLSLHLKSVPGLSR